MNILNAAIPRMLTTAVVPWFRWLYRCETGKFSCYK